MSLQVNIHEAKTHFSKLVTRVQKGEEVVVAKAGRPVLRLVPVVRRPRKRLPGSAKGQVVMAPDFDAELPPDLLHTFES